MPERTRVPRIGLTGPIASGKSTVAEQLAGYGAIVLDADEMAHRSLGAGGSASEPVLAAFGEHLRLPGGGVDRAALGRIVFRDAEALRRLEAIVHPAVRRLLAEGLSAVAPGAPAAVLVVPLLHGGDHTGEVDEVWVVRAPEADRRRRLLARHRGDEDEVARRLALPWPDGRADVEIANQGSPLELLEAAERAWVAFLRRRAG